MSDDTNNGLSDTETGKWADLSRLAPRQKQIFELRQVGKTCSEIAVMLGISRYTVAHHYTLARKNLGLPIDTSRYRHSKVPLTIDRSPAEQPDSIVMTPQDVRQGGNGTRPGPKPGSKNDPSSELAERLEFEARTISVSAVNLLISKLEEIRKELLTVSRGV